MKERTFAAQDYTYGFNGQEQDTELLGGAVSFKYRIHDPRIGRFLSVDPLAPEYPWNSSYAFAENQVISSIDLEGAEAEYGAGGFMTGGKTGTGDLSETDRAKYNKITVAATILVVVTADCVYNRGTFTKRFGSNVAGQATIHYAIMGATGETITFSSLNSRIDYADAAFAIFGGKGFTGTITQVVAPSMIDYTAGGGLIYAGARGGKSWEHVVVDGVTNGVFYGAGKYMTALSEAKLAESKRLTETSKLFAKAIDDYKNPANDAYWHKGLLFARNMRDQIARENFYLETSAFDLDFIANSLTFNWGPDWIGNPIKEAYPAIPLSTPGEIGLLLDDNGIPTYDLPEVTIPYRLPENN